MEIAQSSQTVEVSASALTLDTTSQVQTYSLPSEEVQDLPLNGRNFTQMVNLLPGATSTRTVNGASGINYMIDGIDNNDPANNAPAANQGGVGAIPGTLIPIDAIDEFSAQTQSGPETGKFPGAAVNLTIKSGTNTLHGSLYHYNRNEFFAATNPFTKPGFGKSKIRFFETGGSVGGPILKDRLFYFLAYERQQYVIGNSSSVYEPSAAIIADATAMLKSQGVTPSSIAQPLVNTLWQPFQLAGPDSTGAVPGVAVTPNYYANSDQTGFSNNMMFKMDDALTQSEHLMLRWYWGEGKQVAPVGTPSLNPWYFQAAGMHIHNIAVVLNSQLSPKISNQVLAGVDYFNQPFSDANPNVNAAPTGFIVGLGPGIVQGAPTVTIAGFDGTGQSPFSQRHDFSGHISEILSATYGRNEIRAGGEYRRTQIYEVGNGAGGNGGTRGNFTFDGNRGVNPSNGVQRNQKYPATFPCAAGTCSSNTLLDAVADFLQMAPDQATLVNGLLDRIAGINNFNLFAGDAFRATPKLSLNFGLRWDYLSPIGDDQRDLTVFNPSQAPNSLAPGGGLSVVGQDIKQPYNSSALQFAPRVGVSYQMPREMVLRADYGLYYDTPTTNLWLSTNGLLGNPAGTRPDYNEAATYPIIQPNIPIFPSNPTLPGQCPAGTASCPTENIAGVNKNFSTGDTSNFSVNIEKSFGSEVVAQVGYVGSLGKHLQDVYDLNQTALGAGLNLSPTGANLSSTSNGFAPSQYERPYFSQFPNYAQVKQINSAGYENFSSLQAILRVRNWHGLISEYSYTWSHNLGGPTGTALPTDNFNSKLDYGNLASDLRNQFKGYFTYDVPAARWGPRWLTRDYQLASNLWIHGGTPITATSTVNETGLGEGPDRANLNSDPQYCLYCGTAKHIQKQGQAFQWFNSNAFVNPAPLAFGTTRVGQFYGPGYASFDLSVFKSIPIHERFHAQFRAEMFNVFNRYNYSNPSLSSSSSSGQITSTIGGTSQPGIGPGEPFNVQLALKILF